MTAPVAFFDPQVEYHTQSGRLWVVYSETNSPRPPFTFGTGQNDLSALHIAISKEMVGLAVAVEVGLATPGVEDRRDVWLFQSLFNCNNANLNGDSTTDLYDMALFSSLYDAGARRADMNVDGTTDATDAILYQNAYDAATGP